MYINCAIATYSQYNEETQISKTYIMIDILYEEHHFVLDGVNLSRSDFKIIL